MVAGHGTQFENPDQLYGINDTGEVGGKYGRGMGDIDWGSIIQGGFSTGLDIAHDQLGTYHPKPGEYYQDPNRIGYMLGGNPANQFGISTLPPMSGQTMILVGGGLVALLVVASMFKGR